MKSIPIMCSYIFVSMAYGMMMENAGFAWYYSLLTSLTVYTGAFQFVLITFLSSGASIVTIAVTALLMNSRQSFYSLSFLETFRKMGRKKLYMIHTMTDETYAVNCTIEDKDENSRKEMFLVAFFSRCYWMFGAVMGGLIGQLIPFELNGIDFLYDRIIYHHFYRSMGESGQAFSSNHRNSDRSDRITDLWTDRIYAASIGDRFRSFNLLE